jgi:hypothetical protein
VRAAPVARPEFVAQNLFDFVTALMLESAIWTSCRKPGRKPRRAFAFRDKLLQAQERLRKVSQPRGATAAISCKGLIFLGSTCFRLLFSRFFRFFADISKAATRFSCYLQRFASAVGLHANSERIIAAEGIPYSADMKKTFRRLDKRPTADLGCAVQPATGLQNSWHTR